MFPTKQAAKAGENAAGNGCGDMLRHRGHQLESGETGAPHYQTQGMTGHSFWGNVADLIDVFLPPMFISIDDTV